MKSKTNKEIIYELITAKNAPSSMLWLSKKAGLHKNEVKTILKTLQSEGKIRNSAPKLYVHTQYKESKKNKADKYVNDVKNKKLYKGHIEAHADGYGFFVPENGGEDLFVPRTGLKYAIHKDKVLVRKKRYKGKLEAHVVEILEHSLTEVVGRVEKVRSKYFLVPMHRKFVDLIAIKGAKVSENEIILCKITKYPEEKSYAEGEVVKRLGNIDDKGIENIIMMHKYAITEEFPAQVINEAEKVSQDIPKAVNKKRKDFRDMFTVTIDGETAKDFDDAISIVRQNAGYKLYVHIADVAHYVSENTALDEEAYSRGTSVYFPEFAVPMLPETLSNGACSLRPDEDKFTLTAEITYTPNGLRKAVKLYESVIRSNHRLTYTYVNQVLAGEKEPGKELAELITDANNLTNLIKKRRTEQGMIDFDLADTEIILDDDGNIEAIRPEERGISERIIENFMIEANEVVAETLSMLSEVGMYRNHGSPDTDKIIGWAKTARSLGMDVGRIEAGEVKPKDVQKLFALIPDRPYSYLVKSLLVRSMQRAEYSESNHGHFGLASSYYTHFTSPIRRYPDLVVHRLLKYLYFKTGDVLKKDLEESAKHCSEKERNAEDAERDVTLFKKIKYLQSNPDEVYAAYINKIMSSGFNIFLEELLMVGSVDASALPKGYKIDPEAGVIRRRKGRNLTLGDQVEVIWLKSDIDKLMVDFALYKE